MDWQLPSPFVLDWLIPNEVIDHYGHVNNTAYIAQAETLAWAHSRALGITLDECKRLNRAMVVRTHHAEYLLPCFEGQRLMCATWISASNRKLTLTRKFQYICEKRNKTVFQAQTEFVCVALSTGRVARMPDELYDVYHGAVVGEHE